MVTKRLCVGLLLGSWAGATSREVDRGRLMRVARSFGLVERRFFCCMRRWPLLVAIDLGRCLVMRCCDRLGHESKCPCLMARRRVDGLGLKAQAWRNLARSDLVLAWRMTLLAWCNGDGLVVRRAR